MPARSLPSNSDEIIAYLRSSRNYRGRTTTCRNCGSRSLHVDSPDRYRCRSCRKRFNPVRGSWLASARIPIHKSVQLAWHFAHGSPALAASRSLQLSYPAVLRFYSHIREATLRANWFWINPCSLKNTLADEVIAIEETCGERRTAKQTRSRTSQLSIAIGTKTDPAVKLALAKIETESEYKVMVFTRQYLIECLSGFPDEDRSETERNSRFWKLAKRHMRKFHGITAEKLPGYLGEFAFRANHDRHDLFKALLDTLLEYPQNNRDGSGSS